MARGIPGFTADASLCSGGVSSTRPLRCAAQRLQATVVPQLFMSMPGMATAWLCNKWGDCNWQYVYVGGGSSTDWGINPDLGDTNEKACRARCMRLPAGSVARTDCLDLC